MSNPNPFPGFNTTVNVTTSVKTTISQTPKIHTAGNNGTLIAVILDESGSMSSCRDTTISGFNEFVQGQRSAKNAGQAYLTLVKFNSPKIVTVYDNCLVDNVPQLTRETYAPNGGTNLYDAIGTTIHRVNAVLSKHKRKDRPGVIIVIMTDGHENSSKEYNSKDIKDMVAQAEGKDWTFVFLGANIDAFAQGNLIGMNAANSVNYSTNKMTETFHAVSASTVRMRSAKLSGVDTQTLYGSGLYTQDELKDMK